MSALLTLQPSHQHQPKHLPVTHERPERISESRGTILLNEEMAHPGERSQSADTVEETRSGFAVLAQIIRPEIGK